MSPKYHGIGPLTKIRNEEFIRQAKRQKEEEEKRLALELMNSRPFVYESTASAAQTHIRDQFMNQSRTSSFDGVDTTYGTRMDGNCGHNEYQSEEVPISFWSHQALLHDKGRNQQSHPFFARRCTFTNDIRDGRLRHE